MYLLPMRRTFDRYGSGAFGAGRVDKKHQGQDYLAYPSQPMASLFDCKVERIGQTYSDTKEYRLVVLRYDRQTVLKCMYVDPIVKPGDVLSVGDKIGYVQNISKRYPGMMNHYHFEVIIEGVYVDPHIWLTEYLKRLK